MKDKNINLLEGFHCKNYPIYGETLNNNLSNNHKQLSLTNIITHIIIKDINIKKLQATRKKEMTIKVNLVKMSSHKKGMNFF